MKQELISIQNTPAVVEVNFDELRDSLAKDLERYDVVVTSESVADAKKLATELNKTKKVIDDRRKEEVAKASEPVKRFDEQMKELAQMCGDGRQKLLDQVKRFEDETREKARERLARLLVELWDDFAVMPEFQRAQYDDLVLVSSLTQKGQLTAKARDALKARVNEDKALQDQTRLRLVELENHSNRYGLAAPLTRDHVEHFLFSDEERYQSELHRILNAELDRQVQAEQRERERLERQRKAEEKAEADRQAEEERKRKQAEARAAADVERDRAAARQAREADGQGRENQEGPAEVPRSLEELENDKPLQRTEPIQAYEEEQNGTSWVSVCAEFLIEVPDTVTDEQIRGRLLEQLRDAGFQSTPEIRIVRSS